MKFQEAVTNYTDVITHTSITLVDGKLIAKEKREKKVCEQEFRSSLKAVRPSQRGPILTFFFVCCKVLSFLFSVALPPVTKQSS